MRQLRNTRELKAWLKAGETVELRDRNIAVARIIPAVTETAPIEWPDFAARAKEIFGDRLLPGSDLLSEDRDRF